jgi:flagellar biosynthetic protein FliR
MIGDLEHLARHVAELVAVSGPAALGLMLRIGAIMALLPGLGDTVVPARVRLGLTLAFALVVWPALPVHPHVTLAALVVSETGIGLVLGVGLRLLVQALQIAGTIAAQSVSLSQVLGGAGVDPQPAMAQLLMMAGVTLALMAGLHVRMAELIVLSYAWLPPGQMLTGADMAQWGVARVGHAFGLAFSLALPFVILSLLYNLALGAINKAMPQLMVAFVGAPAITLGGLALLMLTAPLLLPLWHGTFLALLSDPTGLPR